MKEIEISKKLAEETLGDLWKLHNKANRLSKGVGFAQKRVLIIDELELVIGQVKCLVTNLEKMEQERYTKW